MILALTQLHVGFTPTFIVAIWLHQYQALGK